MDSPVASLPLITPQPGFLCGTVPVPTATESHSKELVTVQASSMEVVSDSSASLKYSFLPAEMDLNDLPANWLKREELFLHLFPDKEAPDTNIADLCSSCISHSVAYPLPKKCEDLAVSGLVAYGDEIDFIAPANVMKQIFKTPYSKARVSVAVHRIGKTLILNDGPDAVESKSKQSSQTMTLNKDLFYKFVHHSVNSAAPTIDSDAEHEQLPPQENPCRAWQFYTGGGAQDPGERAPYVDTPDSPQTSFQDCEDDVADESTWRTGKASRGPKRRGFGSKKRGRAGRALGKRGVTSQSVRVTSEPEVSAGGACMSEEEPNSSEAEEGGGFRGPKEGGRERFLRVLFWKFRELQMLLGSDLLLFGNEQHKAVSLHLMEVERQMSPLTWLDAWLDNMMANVPELAVCYHKQGVVQGYELLKTDDLFLLKGVGADGTINFHPQVVHANAAAVLQFLQENCTSEPGAYWLVKNAGEDLMQLFDLSTISDEPDLPSETDDEAPPLPDVSNPRGPESYKQALALLIYRLALQLARSNVGSDQRRSGSLLTQCLELMEDTKMPDLVAAAHERMAKLCLQQAVLPPLITPQLLLEAAPSERLKGSGVAEKYLPAPESSPSQQAVPAVKNELPMLPSSSVDGAGAFAMPEEKDMGNETVSGGTEVSGEEKVEKAGMSKEVSVQKGFTLQAPDDSSQDLSQEESVLGERVNVVLPQASASSSGPPPEEAIHRHLSAVHHFSEAVKALREELTMLSSKPGGQRRPSKKAPSGDGSEKGEKEERGRTCKGIRHEARIARTELKLRKLMGYLMKSYLELGRAYDGDGQLARALKAAELASTTGGWIMAQEEGEVKGENRPLTQLQDHGHQSAQQKQSEPRLEESDLTPRGNGSGKVVELQQESGSLANRSAGRKSCRQKSRATSSPGAGTGESPKSARPEFWGSLWTFVADLYVRMQQSWTEEDLCAQQAALLTGAPRLEEAVAEIVKGWEGGRSSGLAESSQIKVSGLAGTESNGTAGTSGGKSGRETPKKGIRGLKSAREAATGADLLCFGKPLSVDYEVNLTAAAESYGKAVAVLELEGGSKGGEKWERAHRRLGWTCNEIGRRRLEEGDISTSEGLFTQALNSFSAVKDTANAVLVHCNMGHARRGQAEAMAAEGAKLEQTPAGEGLKQVRIAHISHCYRRALSHYIAARSELLSLGEAEAQRSLRGLWTEAHTQLGHTYLRFGMYLSSVSNDNVNAPGVVSRKERARTRAPETESVSSELLTKALHLYESLGPTRAQEAAYSHCQLAGHFRDRCLQSRPAHDVSAEAALGAGNRNEDVRWKRFAALAEFHWEKALDFYSGKSHPDMFLRISIDRSALGLKCAAKSRPGQVLESALSPLAGIVDVFGSQTSASGAKTEREPQPQPSTQSVAGLKGHLEWVSREVLQAYVSFLKFKSCLDGSAASAIKDTVSKLKLLYKELLQVQDSRAVLKVLQNMLNERPL